MERLEKKRLTRRWTSRVGVIDVEDPEELVWFLHGGNPRNKTVKEEGITVSLESDI